MRWWPMLGLVVSTAALAGGWKTLVSPGALGDAHADISGDCDQCHLVFEGIPDAQCLDCHEALAERIEAGVGFHASEERACIACHTDHHGQGGALTREDSLAAFDHAATGFDLHGAHADVSCETCHDKPIGQMQSVCIECHADGDPHGSALGPECGACHVTTAWDRELKAIADHQVGMHGGHGGLLCEECHVQGAHLVDDARCNDCHPEGHGGTTTRCDQCHEVDGWTPAEFDHGPCTCTFAGAHQTAPCLSCHPDFTFTDTPELCSGCHAEDRSHEPLGECSLCHEATSWSDNLFDHNKRAAFHLDGEHLIVDCAGCHTEPGTFRGLPSACEGCHAERRAEAHGDFGPCADCHTTEGAGWLPSIFDHASTGFPLTGRHDELSCQDCHSGKTEGFGR